MPSRGWSTDKLRILAIAGSLTMTAACDENHSKAPHLVAFASPFVATPLISTSIVPQRIGLTPLFGIRCPVFPSVTTRFDLVLNLAGTSDLFMQQATFRLLDGTHVGGSPLLVSAGELSARFGTTVIRAGSRRSFRFDPQFGCGSFVPLSLSIDLLLLDRLGSRHATTLVVPIG
jgi:hypothetical protein